jgi:hypothetical protein
MQAYAPNQRLQTQSVRKKFSGIKILSDGLACEIYRFKIAFVVNGSAKQPASAKLKGKSSKISQMFGVSAKAVRDIWNHNSWRYATSHLWKDLTNSSKTDLNGPEVIDFIYRFTMRLTQEFSNIDPESSSGQTKGVS